LSRSGNEVNPWLSSRPARMRALRTKERAVNSGVSRPRNSRVFATKPGGSSGPPVATRKDASSAATTNGGAKCAMSASRPSCRDSNTCPASTSSHIPTTLVFRPIESEDVNQYLREISGEELSAKDFRTWAGTILAATALAELASAERTHRARAHRPGDRRHAPPEVRSSARERGPWGVGWRWRGDHACPAHRRQ
jgi:DNA topoisomerase I-like protein